MILKKKLLNLTAVCAITPMGFNLIPSPHLSIQPTLATPKKAVSKQIAQVFQPPKTNLPSSTAGGGSRGQKIAENPIAVIPISKVGLTTSEYPTFFLYLPYTSPQKLNFVLQDEEENIIYETKFISSGKPGIVSISLPANPKNSLQINKNYYWYFEVVVNSKDSSENPHIEGWVKRIEPSKKFNADLAKLTERDRPNLYAQNGIWFETVTSAAQLRCDYPNDVKVLINWRKLLNSVGLNAIAQQPLINQCKPKN